jgi:hypothetical protein
MPTVLDRQSILSAIADEKLGYAFGKPERVNDESLSVVMPILRDTVIPRIYTTFPETDKLKVNDSGHIAVVKAKNDGDKTVYIRSGTIFKGETQPRTAVRSTIVLPGATVEIQVRCVHASRGISPNAKVAYGGTIPLDMEQAIYTTGFQPADQGHYWNTVRSSVSNMNYMMGRGPEPSASPRPRATPRPDLRSAGVRADSRLYQRPIRPGQPQMSSGYIRPTSMNIDSSGHVTQDFGGVAADPQFDAGVFSSAAAGGDDLASNYTQFSAAFDDVLSRVNLQEKQAGLALITIRGCQTIEVFDAQDSWKALHDDAVRRMGANMAGKDDPSVFEYKPEKAVEVVRNVLRLPFEENLIHEHKPNNGEPHFSLTGLSAKGWTGEVVELDGKVIHLMLLRIAG